MVEIDSLTLACHYSIQPTVNFNLSFPLTLCGLEAKVLETLEVIHGYSSCYRFAQHPFKWKGLISFEEAMEKLSRDDRFRATVYAMNTLLLQKGVYSPEEFEFQFRQFAQKQFK